RPKEPVPISTPTFTIVDAHTPARISNPRHTDLRSRVFSLSAPPWGSLARLVPAKSCSEVAFRDCEPSRPARLARPPRALDAKANRASSTSNLHASSPHRWLPKYVRL